MMRRRVVPASGASALSTARVVVPGQLDLLDAIDDATDGVIDDPMDDAIGGAIDGGFSGPVVVDDDARAEPVIEVRRSARRRRTVSAYRDGERTIVLLPARLTKKQEREWVAAMVEQLDERDRRTRPGDAELMERAEELSGRYLGGRAVPASVRWVSNQREQWGSCTPTDRTIRLSDRLLGMPTWVVDYVLLHELAHLIVPSHGPDFWALLKGFTRLERARGFLEGLTAASRA